MTKKPTASSTNDHIAHVELLLDVAEHSIYTRRVVTPQEAIRLSEEFGEAYDRRHLALASDLEQYREERALDYEGALSPGELKILFKLLSKLRAKRGGKRRAPGAICRRGFEATYGQPD